MKGLKRGILAFLAGEVAILWKKDKSFQETMQQKEGFDKVSYLFEKLFNFNKELVVDAHEALQGLDVKSELENVKMVVTQEAANFKAFAIEKQALLTSMSNEELDHLKDEAKARLESFKEYVGAYASDTIKKYHLQEKLDEVKETYEVLKGKMHDIREA